MSYLHPIQPLVHLPTGGSTVRLDRSTADQRRHELAKGSNSGLARLIRHPRTPVTAREGVDSGIWTPNGKRGVYLHREDYTLPGGVEKSRWSAIVELDPDTCPLRPVVESDPMEVERLMDSLESAGVDPGGVTALFRDENHHLEQLVEARSGIPPLITIQDPMSGRHCLWRLSEEEGEAVIALLERCGTAIVSDVGLYRALVRLRHRPGVPRTVRPIVHFYHQRDFGVTFAATARIHGLDDAFDINQLLACLHERYVVKEYLVRGDLPSSEAHRELLEHIRTDGITQRVIGVLVRGSRTAFQITVPEGSTPSFGDAELSDAAREFDVQWVQRGIVDVLLPADCRTPLHVLSEPKCAPHALSEGEGRVAFIVNPPPKRFIPNLSREGTPLPLGALQVKPPGPRGLVLSPLPSLKLLS